MKKNYQPREAAKTECDALDSALDAALAKCGAVEPREGLEERILARLQSETRTFPTYSWWQWSAVGAVATLLVITVALAWKSSKPVNRLVQQRPSAPIEASHLSAARTINSQIAPVLPLTTHRTPKKALPRSDAPMIVADGPKLDKFPSPRPLSEQEKQALEYVERFPDEAFLIAQAQTTLAKQQELENGDAESNPR
jgi:hypothetical protein